jgi:indolepyruvate ferredoxin oxidoreductase
VPVSLQAILDAIDLNGAAVERNKRAFDIGRWAVLHPQEAARIITPNVIERPKTEREEIDYRTAHLEAYQGKRLARRYRAFLDKIDDPDIRKAASRSYHKLLSYKDEYEVARLHLTSEQKAREAFEGDFRMTYHLAPPLLSRKGPGGRPKKRAFSRGMPRLFRVLARMKFLRGTPFDPFGYSAERRHERALIRQYEADLRHVLPKLTDRTKDSIVALAELPMTIRGFGPVKAQNMAKAELRRADLIRVIDAGGLDMAKAAE